MHQGMIDEIDEIDVRKEDIQKWEGHSEVLDHCICIATLL